MTVNDGRKNVTISDVARAAGVSKTTVSRFINGKFSLMSPDTRERIAAVIEMSHYRPSSIAQSLKAKQSYQIGVVVGDVASPFSASLIRGVGHVLLENDYVALFADSKGSLELETRLIQTLVSRKVDGLIVNTSDCSNPSLIQLACQGMPVVLCDRQINDYNFTFVGAEHRQPILKLVAHLKEEGFYTAAFFTEDYSANSARFTRRDAFLEAMALHYPGQDAQRLSFSIDISDHAATIRAIEDLLALCGSRVPAIIGVNTVTTMHVVGALRAMGLDIPRQVGICGPDDWGWAEQIDWPAIISPGITTFTVDPYAIGCTAAQILLRQIRDPASEKQDIRLPSDLVVRGSTLLRAALAERAR